MKMELQSWGEARERWQLDNNITTTLEPDSLNNGDDDVLGEPWINDPLYFKQLNISEKALLKLVMDASSDDCKFMEDSIKRLIRSCKETVGLLKGKVSGDAFIILDLVALTAIHVDSNSVSSVDLHSQLLDYFEKEKAAKMTVQGCENVVGWYRTSRIGEIISPSDISTQMRIQELKQSPSCALIIDSSSITDAYSVRVHALRTYPESYKPPDVEFEITGKYGYLKRRLLECTEHLRKRYSLNTTYFKTSSDGHIVHDIWEKYWAHLVSMSIRNQQPVHQKFETKENKEGPITVFL